MPWIEQSSAECKFEKKKTKFYCYDDYDDDKI